MNSFSEAAFFGALAIFIYGIRISRDAIQLLAGERLRTLVSSLTEKRIAALFTGILMTLILQSSTAVNMMLVGFSSTGIITLSQAMGVMLGAGIGTSLVSVLFSIRDLAEYALALVAVGVFLDVLASQKKTRHIAMAILGLGFTFFGMKMMIQTTLPLRENQLMIHIFSTLGQYPIHAFLVSVIFTAVVQNSATTMGMTIALALSGLLDFSQALPFVLGANVGTCVGPLVGSLRNGKASFRAGLVQLMFKSFTAIVCLIFLGPLSLALTDVFTRIPLASNIGAQIAVTHIAFNISLALIFFPAIPWGAKLVTNLIPDDPCPVKTPFGPKYLDTKALETPSLAFANAKREILRMAEIASAMFQAAPDIMDKTQQGQLSAIEEKEDQVDILDHSIKLYLARISQEALSSEQARLQLGLVSITNNLEGICDVISKHILGLAKKKIGRDVEFSGEGQEEIRDFHSKVNENFHLTLSYLASEDVILARKILRHESYMTILEDKYRQAHLMRLHRGLKETIETSSIHLDLLASFRLINTKLASVIDANLAQIEKKTA